MLEALQGCLSELPVWGVADAGRVWAAMPEHKRARARRELDLPGEADPLPGLLAVLFPYYAGQAAGNLSLYARGKDYHGVALAALGAACARLEAAFSGQVFRPYADASPYPEVLAAATAGLGRVGLNTLLIHPRWGSFVFIGLIASDMRIPGGQEPLPCPGCGQCLSACPGGALTGTGLERSRCLSHLTQKKGALSADEEALIRSSDLIWGCDRCQLCCPLNREIEPSAEAAFTRDLILSIAAEDIPADEGAFLKKYPDRAFTWRGPEVLRRNLALFDGEV